MYPYKVLTKQIAGLSHLKKDAYTESHLQVSLTVPKYLDYLVTKAP